MLELFFVKICNSFIKLLAKGQETKLTSGLNPAVGCKKTFSRSLFILGSALQILKIKTILQFNSSNNRG
jgi:hypothetical protein